MARASGGGDARRGWSDLTPFQPLIELAIGTKHSPSLSASARAVASSALYRGVTDGRLAAVDLRMPSMPAPSPSPSPSMSPLPSASPSLSPSLNSTMPPSLSSSLSSPLSLATAAALAAALAALALGVDAFAAPSMATNSLSAPRPEALNPPPCCCRCCRWSTRCCRERSASASASASSSASASISSISSAVGVSGGSGSSAGSGIVGTQQPLGDGSTSPRGAALGGPVALPWIIMWSWISSSVSVSDAFLVIPRMPGASAATAASDDPWRPSSCFT